MNKGKKLIAFILAIAIVLSGAIVPMNSVSAAEDDGIKAMKAAEEDSNSKNKDSKKVEKTENFDKDEKVRVIVELDKKPALSLANDKKVAFSTLSEKEKKEIEKNVLSEQKTVKSSISSRNINMAYKNEFTVAFNGFSGEVKYGDIQFIEKIRNVKKVYIANEYERPQPQMKNSGEMIGLKPTWDLNIKGEEQVVAILDTGIDYTHKDMVLDDDTKVSLSKKDVEGRDVKGKYFTKKVPYGYNYYDLNNEVIDKGPDPSMHGMHVAGTAGANGDLDKDGIKGVAPHSQLLAMKVFSNDPIYATTFSDIYLVAIDESIKLGADVINMSLGSPSGFYNPDSAENEALKRAEENGIVSAISAGNSGTIVDGWSDTNFGYPIRENPDIGVVGSPGLNEPTISVASIDNEKINVSFLEYSLGKGSSTSKVQRLAGDKRELTAVEVSKEMYDKAENVILANGYDFPDALASSALAKTLKAPILLTHDEKLSSDTLAEIGRLSAKNVYVAGGKGAVSEAVVAKLNGEGLKVIRLAGDKREATAAEIGQVLVDESSPDTAILVNGYDFPDALSAGAPAASKGYPILFVNTDQLTDTTKDALANWNIKNIKLIGGKGVVSDSIKDELDKNYSVERIAGDNRESTAIEVAKKFFPDSKKALIANGYNFPDGLVGGPLAGKLDAPVLLVNTDKMRDEVKTYLKDTKKDITILGGSGVVSEGLEKEISQAINAGGSNGGETVRAPMSPAGPTPLSKAFDGEVEYIYGGLGGSVEEIGDATGKVALIMRGAYAFVDKITNAAKAGAAGVIVFNSESGGEGLISMQYPAGLEIPAGFIGHDDGMKLKDEVDPKVMKFPEGTIEAPNPTGGQMSDFTSWGTTPSLEMKPEITAPGGSIFSTLNNDRYGVMSGTSMAAPHVAGGSALALEYIKEASYFNGISNQERAKFAKAILMNTSELVKDEYDELISPRRQGAGLMNLYNAVSTPVIAVDKVTKEAKVELKEFNDTTIKMRLTAHNFSDKQVGYELKVDTLKDAIDTSTGEDLNLLVSEPLEATVSGDSFVVVEANSSEEFEVIVDISEDEDVSKYSNMFVEGFITLEEITDSYPNIKVPFVGFYGNWDEPKIIDGLSYQDDFGKSYFDFSGFGREAEDGLYFYEKEDIYMNPGTEPGEKFGYGNIVPILSFLRNAREVQYKITDKDGNELRNIFTDNYVTKNYIDGGSKQPYTIVSQARWDGKVDKNFVEDGNYFYEIKAKIDYKDADYQTYKMPITVDTKGPEVSDIKYDPSTRELSFKAIDQGAGLNMMRFMVDGKVVNDLTINAEEGKDNYSLKLPESVKSSSRLAILAYDNIYNYTIKNIEEFAKEEPYIFIIEPGLLKVYDTSEVRVEGYVTNVNTLEKVMIDETEADIEFLEDAKVENPEDPDELLIDGPAYKFTKTLNLEDGYKEMKIKALTESGQESSLTRRFYVDTTNPELSYQVLDREDTSDKATIRFKLNDNLAYLRLLESDSQIFIYDGFEEAVEVGPTEKTFDYEVDLEVGKNTFNFTLFDIADHQAEETVEIERTEESEQ